MSTRKLNRQQRWRIDKIQEERIARLARREARAHSLLEEGGLAGERPGLVLAHYGTQVHVESLPDDPQGPCLQRCHRRANLPALATGDRVLWQPAALEDGIGVVSALLPRRSLLERPDGHGHSKPIAANIDQLLIVIAPQPTTRDLSIDRYLVAAHAADLQPLLVLNKRDLAEAADLARLDRYRHLGYDCLSLSARSGELDELRQILPGRVSAFVGLSGVGKSSLVNALLPDIQQVTRELSSHSGLGQHTTTTARLFHLPGGGDLIDSPGIREFGLGLLTGEQILAGFPEIASWRGRCRFRNCRHEHEPGCAFVAAVAAGELSQERFASLRSLLADGDAATDD